MGVSCNLVSESECQRALRKTGDECDADHYVSNWSTGGEADERGIRPCAVESMKSSH